MHPPSSSPRRQAFRKYDADNSDSIDADELRAVLADMHFFDGLDEAGQASLVNATLEEVDVNTDNTLNFREFTTCYNKLKSKTEELDAGGKLPSIFGGEELSAGEQLRVKAMPKMLDRGVFSPRRKEAASKDYFDTTAVRDKMFKADWSRVDKKPSFAKFKQDVGLAVYDSKAGKLKATPLLKFFKTLMRTHYDMLCNAYTYYGCRDLDGAFHAMDFSEYIEFARSAGFRV